MCLRARHGAVSTDVCFRFLLLLSHWHPGLGWRARDVEIHLNGDGGSARLTLESIDE
jgi:hypothetical protein